MIDTNFNFTTICYSCINQFDKSTIALKYSATVSTSKYLLDELLKWLKYQTYIIEEKSHL